MRAPVSIPTALIYPSANGRPVVKGHVQTLAESLKAIGLQSPITVRPCVRVRDGRDADVYEIVAGRHRYEAAVSLNWKEIDAFVMEGDPDDAELWEIDENFARAELTPAQRADHHSRRQRILISRGVVAARGGDRKSSQVESLKSYAEEAAETLGVGLSTIRRDIGRGQRIDPAVLADIAGTDLDKGVVLDRLAVTPREQQRALVEQMRSTVRLAPDPLNDPEAHEKQLAALMSAWNRAAGPVREEFMLRIDRPVFDGARIARRAGAE